MDKHPKPRKRITKEQEAIILKMVEERKDMKEISKFLGIGVFATRQRMTEMGIDTRNYQNVTEKEAAEMLSLYKSGVPVGQIADKFKRGDFTVKKHLTLLGIEFPKARFKRIMRINAKLKHENKFCCRYCEKVNDNSMRAYQKSVCLDCSKVFIKDTYNKFNDRASIATALSRRLTYIKPRAKHFQMDYDLDLDFLIKLYNEQDGKCAYTKFPMQRIGRSNMSISVDRIDSDKGYVKGNVVLCLTCINLMKHKCSTNDFVRFCRIISENNPTLGLDDFSKDYNANPDKKDCF